LLIVKEGAKVFSLVGITPGEVVSAFAGTRVLAGRASMGVGAMDPITYCGRSNDDGRSLPLFGVLHPATPGGQCAFDPITALRYE